MSFNDCVLFQYDYSLVVHEEAGPFSFTVYTNFTAYSRKLKLGRSLTDAPFSDPPKILARLPTENTWRIFKLSKCLDPTPS